MNFRENINYKYISYVSIIKLTLINDKVDYEINIYIYIYIIPDIQE